MENVSEFDSLTMQRTQHFYDGVLFQDSRPSGSSCLVIFHLEMTILEGFHTGNGWILLELVVLRSVVYILSIYLYLISWGYFGGIAEGILHFVAKSAGKSRLIETRPRRK